MARPAIARGVDNPDVEPAGDGVRLVKDIVHSNCPLREAAAMQCDFELFDPNCCCCVGRKLENVVGQRDCFCNDALRIVVALQYEHANPHVVQSRQFAEEEANRGVFPIAVINVAGNNHKRDFCLDCRMPPLSQLRPAQMSRASRIWMIVLRGYLVLAGGLVLVRIIMLAMNN